MLSFDRFPDDWNGGRTESVHVNPHLVATVRQTERQGAHGGSSLVAVILMQDGDGYVVYDVSRSVVPQITAANSRSAGGHGE